MAEVAIAFVGLASSIVTFLDVSAKIIVLIRECKASVNDDRFQDIESQLPLIREVLESVQNDVKSQKIDPATANALQNATEGCIRQAGAIEGLIERMIIDPNDSKVKRILGAVTRVRTDKKVAEAWRILETYKATITMYLARASQLTNTDLPASRTTSSSFNVPTSSIAKFIGREDLLSSLKNILYPSPSAASHGRAAVLYGMGGQGKTQTALEFCRHATLEAAFEYVYWIDCFTIESILLDFETIAKKTASGKAQFPDAQAAVHYVLESLSKAKQPWLLVFDNLDAPIVFQNIRDYVPMASASGSVLYISRHADTARLGLPLQIDGMTESEAVQLLLSQSQTDSTVENISHSKNIANELGFFPLALDQAASYIRSRRLPLSEFIPTYTQRKADTLRHTPKLWEYKRRLQDSTTFATNAFTTWELSLSLLLSETDGKSIARLLTLSAFFDPQNLHSTLFTAFAQLPGTSSTWAGSVCITSGVWDEYKFQDIVANLLSLSLIQSMELSPDGVSFSLHPLVKDWIQHRLSEEEYIHYAYEAVETLGAAASQVSLDRITPSARRRIIANMDACIRGIQPVLLRDRHSEGYNSLVFLGSVAHCYLELGKYAAGRDLYKTILELRLAQPRPSHDLSHTSTTMNFAIATTHLGYYSEAKKLYESVLQEREHGLGPDHEGTQRARHGLATAEMYLENYEAAANIFESLLRAQYTQLSERRTAFFQTVGQLASVYRFTEDFPLARTCCEMAVMESIKLLGPHHLTTLAELEGLAIVYRNMHRVAEAIKLYAHILPRYEATLGWEHPHTLRLATNYGIALMHQKKHDEGIRVLETASEGLGGPPWRQSSRHAVEQASHRRRQTLS